MIAKIRIAAIAAAAALIGAQFLLGEVPPALGYPLLAILAGGALFIKGHDWWMGYRRAASRSAEGGRTYLTVSIVLVVVIGVGGFFFIRS